MSTTPSGRTRGQIMAGPLARMWTNSDGPTHDSISSAIQSAGLSPEAFHGSKEARVRTALAEADEQQATDLITDLVELLSEGGYLASSHYNARAVKLRAALAKVGATLNDDGELTWSSGDQSQHRSTAASPEADLPITRADEEQIVSAQTIFLVHGHDESLRDKIEMQLRRWNATLKIVILDQQASQGRTLVEKFEQHADTAAFAVVIATPDDEGRVKGAEELNPRARQNVIFEMGYFFGKLGRHRVVVMNAGIEEPSDVDGVVYIDPTGSGWRQRLGRELKAAGIDGDWLN